MKIIAVGMNYALHNKELGHTLVNKEPVIFMKPDSAILKDGKTVFLFPIFRMRFITKLRWWYVSAVWEKTLRRALPIVIMTQ